MRTFSEGNMGRKKLPIGKVRKVITISLPPDLVADFDKKYKGIRSRAIERLMRRDLMNNGQSNLFGTSYLYGCRTCDFEGRSAKNFLTWCRSCEDDTLYVAKASFIEEEEE
jgi:metal-responsive CopG/Arc/MetJ family transcriptional regulator